MAGKVTELRVENVKRIKYIAVTLGDGVVRVAGDNGQGKTSALDSIAYALRGTRNIPEEPIRNGEESGSILLKTSDGYQVERTFKQGKTSSLKITNAEGAPQKAPQSLADSWWSDVAADPLEFSRAKPERRLEVLRELTGINLQDLDRRKSEAYETRRDIGRDLRRDEAALGKMVFHRDAPDTEPSAEALDKRYAEAQKILNERLQCETAIRHKTIAAEACRERIASLESQIQREKTELQQHLDAKNLAEEILRKASDPDIASIDEERRKLNDVVDRVRQNRAYHQAKEQLEKIRSKHKELDDELESIEQEKKALISQAKLPVPEIGFGEADVTINGLPWEQASGAERLRVSSAMALASHPELRLLLIRDGSLLDKKSMAMLEQLAEEYDAQILVERIDTDGAEIVIEDGMVSHDE